MHRSSPADSRELRHVRVLIVEQDDARACGIRGSLERAGATVRVARSAEQALRELPGFAADAVVIDVALPTTSGLLLARMLKAEVATRDAVLVSLSAASVPGLERVASDAGCVAHLSGPIDEEALTSTLRVHLGRA